MNSANGLSLSAKSERDSESSWETPLWLVERIRDLMGGIELDPCSTLENPTKASRFYTPANDGILHPWEARSIYVNPPYGRTIKHWIEKVLAASDTAAKVVLLVPARTDARWFHDAYNAATSALFFRGRLRFSGSDVNAPFPNVLLGYNIDLTPLADLGILVAA